MTALPGGRGVVGDYAQSCRLGDCCQQAGFTVEEESGISRR
jgi:hypothetical protein